MEERNKNLGQSKCLLCVLNRYFMKGILLVLLPVLGSFSSWTVVNLCSHQNHRYRHEKNQQKMHKRSVKFDL